VTGPPAPSGGAAAVLRPRYREGQPLRARDLVAEQRYRLAGRRRHDSGHHQWGIVSGLALASTTIGTVLVQHGLAVDGYGRGLVVPEPRPIPPDALDRLAAAAVEVWLLYGRAPMTPTRPGRWDCGPGRHSRFDERPLVRLVAEADAVDPRRPPEVPDADLVTRPEPPPDEPQREWPVYLGRLERVAGGGWRVDHRDRPYTALVGESLTAPDGLARLQLGSELPGDPRRFTVAVADPPGPRSDRLRIDRDGAVTVHGDTRLEGNLVVAAVTTGGAQGVAFRPLAAVPNAAAPWRLYRAETAQADQLRIELAQPGEQGDPARYRLAVGTVEADGSFRPRLTVGADCVTTVHGNLTVEGLLVEGPVAADIEDPRLAPALIGSWLGATTSASRSLDRRLAGALEVTIAEDANPTAGTDFDYTVTVRNSGTVDAVGVETFEARSANGSPPDTTSIAGPAAMAAGTSVEIDRTVPGADLVAGNKLFIGVTAIGVGPPGVPVQASATRTFDIQPGGIG
jgi:hypothetical protein